MVRHSGTTAELSRSVIRDARLAGVDAREGCQVSLKYNLIENGRTSALYVSRGGMAVLFTSAANEFRGQKLTEVECEHGRVEMRP